jgi:hypothetical protein
MRFSEWRTIWKLGLLATVVVYCFQLRVQTQVQTELVRVQASEYLRVPVPQPEVYHIIVLVKSRPALFERTFSRLLQGTTYLLLAQIDPFNKLLILTSAT